MRGGSGAVEFHCREEGIPYSIVGSGQRLLERKGLPNSTAVSNIQNVTIYS